MTLARIPFAPRMRLALGSLLVLAISSQAPCLADEPVAGAGSSGKVIYGQVGAFDALTDGVQDSLGFHCYTDRNGQVQVGEVQKGSEAFEAGLQAGDHITNAVRRANVFELTVDRQGQPNTFQLRLNSEQPNFSYRIARPDTNGTPFKLNAQQIAAFADRNQRPRFAVSVTQAARTLAGYDVELIVDRSMSMHKPDCPGMLSRWQWCGSQSEDLGNQLAPLVPQGVTITPFARFYKVFEHLNPQQISELFNGTDLQLGTRLAEPLSDRLNTYFAQRTSKSKPKLIAVITDGVPRPIYEEQMVINVLINASKQLHDPRELTVVFLQIGGHDARGFNYLQGLDNNLVSWGARCDYVQMVPFDHLVQVGLAQALVDSIQQFEAGR